jgi:hypothetical protein
MSLKGNEIERALASRRKELSVGGAIMRGIGDIRIGKLKNGQINLNGRFRKANVRKKSNRIFTQQSQ